jgi:UDPglucose--hexose-1-phosphate uridylyltransferase
MRWKYPSEYGEMDITINLSKPEKDPKAIAAAKAAPQSGYPKCQLCPENAGYAGHLNHPARQNHRPIPITVTGEDWYLQYSPYGYFNEHCILFHSEHVPMKVDRRTLERLMGFVEKYPHYKMGSNAGLPIIGGSILTHDHYQGGNYDFPVNKCGYRSTFKIEGFEDVEAGIVDWAMSTIRISSPNKNRVIELAEKIRLAWNDFTDEDNNIIAYTDAPHNAITPIASFKDGKFVFDLILRNNRTTEEYPYGIFHAHEEYHHIKKENIGLIEAMGLAVLPPRLTTQFGDLNDSVKTEIGTVFGKILENCAVFKNTEAGNSGFTKFINSVK